MDSIYADRSERAKLRVTGPQALWFLDQVLTQKFDDMAPGEARDAAMITVHGRMTAFLECLATQDGVLAHLEPELREGTLDNLARYVFATRVEIDDVTEEMGLVLIAGPDWEATARARAPGAPVHQTRALGVPAAYLWSPREEVPGLVQALEGSGCRRAGEDELEAVRITHGAPRWGRDMDPKTFPQEAGIDSFAVQYEKGCYLGQEAMAKIHFRGKVNRRLARLHAEAPVEVGAEVHVDGAKAGRVTSAAGEDALALVRHTVEPGSDVTVGGSTATVVA
ncbi:MAG: YgfZ/GcvT domain-containing protein [Candidatus Rokuibacteriota bacterium]